MPNPSDGTPAADQAQAPEPMAESEKVETGGKVDERGNRIVEPGLPPIAPQMAPARPAGAVRHHEAQRRAPFLADNHVPAVHRLKG